jgi:hypothetical protein
VRIQSPQESFESLSLLLVRPVQEADKTLLHGLGNILGVSAPFAILFPEKIP